MGARMVRDHEAAGSIPVAPTIDISGFKVSINNYIFYFNPPFTHFFYNSKRDNFAISFFLIRFSKFRLFCSGTVKIVSYLFRCLV